MINNYVSEMPTFTDFERRTPPVTSRKGVKRKRGGVVSSSNAEQPSGLDGWLQATAGVEFQPEGAASDALPYLVNSIPTRFANGSKPTHGHWLVLGAAIKSVDAGAFELFWTWMQRRGVVVEEEE